MKKINRFSLCAVMSIVLLALCPTEGSGQVITEIIDSTGDGGGNDLRFAAGIAVDGSGNVYVGGLGSNNVFEINFEVCGDGLLDPGEECDDGNTTSFDGCSSFCEIEGELIPTVSAWGLLLLAVMLLGTSGWLLRRRLGERG